MKTYAPFASLFALMLAAGSLQAQGTPAPPAPGANSQPAPAVPVVLANRVPLCKGNQLSLTTDGEDGNFAGMQQNGTLLVLRNFGPEACRFPSVPQIELLGKNGPLNVTGRITGFAGPAHAGHMGHGPVALPVVVASGAELTSTLHWVAGEVYDRSACVDATSLQLTGTDGKLTTEFSAHICGEAGKPVTFDQTRFAPDPVFQPQPAAAK